MTNIENRTVVFILNSLEQQRCHKRIREFLDNGYQVRVYAFNRKYGVEVRNFDRYEVEVIGEFGNTLSYFQRINLMRKGIKKVVKAHKKQPVIYYLFNLDVAVIAYWLIKNKPYIYEESDLTHTYLSNALLKKVLDKLDKRIIRHSLMTVMTSGGFVKYHFKGGCPENVWVIPNKLNPYVNEYPQIAKESVDIDHIRFGFVGHLRGQALINFVEVLVRHFPQHEMHFFGVCVENYLPKFKVFEKYENVYFHGHFSNPQDLAKVYSQIDIVISTYDTTQENVLYAEPNKIYEAIYFNTPIVVSRGTYLAERVDDMGIGYALDAMSEKEICQFIKGLTIDSIAEKAHGAAMIDKKSAVDDNRDFFSFLKRR